MGLQSHYYTRVTETVAWLGLSSWMITAAGLHRPLQRWCNSTPITTGLHLHATPMHLTETDYRDGTTGGDGWSKGLIACLAVGAAS